MVKRSYQEIMAKIHAGYERRSEANKFFIARDRGEELSGGYGGYGKKELDERTRDRLLQTKNKHKITLPKIKW